jgi:hypothetical protein
MVIYTATQNAILLPGHGRSNLLFTYMYKYHILELLIFICNFCKHEILFASVIKTKKERDAITLEQKKWVIAPSPSNTGTEKPAIISLK